MAKQPASNTVPLVEPDGSGGHVPYVRPDTTPTTDYPPAYVVLIDVLRELLEVTREMRDECRAARLALQERFNEGALTQHDFLEMAQAVRDGDEEA